jgi:hypothetical protein
MIRLEQTSNAWGSDDFASVAKHEIEQIASERLPLQQGLTQSSYVQNGPFTVSVLNVADDQNSIRIKAGVFYTGLIPGCNCADDPTPMDEYNEYCELLFAIDKQTAETTVTLVRD